MHPENIQQITTLDPSHPISHQGQECIKTILEGLNTGLLRVAEPTENGWIHHRWAQKAVQLYFKISTVHAHDTPWPHRDLIQNKYPDAKSFDGSGIRIVPPAYVRYGAYIGPSCVLMPCFVNIGAYVGKGSMLDTWSTVGSCAQIGERVHLSGGAGIGGVLEPASAMPTIIENDVFIGARTEIAEGVRVCEGAVIAPGVFLTQSTKIYDRISKKTFTGIVPPNAVVVPGSLPAKDHSHSLQAAIIVKYADEKTRGKTALNAWLRAQQ